MNNEKFWINLRRYINGNVKLSEEQMSVYNNYYNWYYRKGGKFNNDKGLIIGGKVGCGKTTLIKAVAFDNNVNNFDNYNNHDNTDNPGMYWISANKIRYEIDNDYYHNAHRNNWLYKQNSILVIDDLGQEPEKIICYGNIVDIMGRMIDELYDDYIDFKFRLLATTNLAPEALRERYTERTYSRLRGMCDYIVYPGDDRR